MTCQEVRAMFDKSIKECTRAERAAVKKHVDQCDSCFIYLQLCPDRGPSSGMTTAEIHQMLKEDWRDPEYRQMVS